MPLDAPRLLRVVPEALIGTALPLYGLRKAFLPKQSDSPKGIALDCYAKRNENLGFRVTSRAAYLRVRLLLQPRCGSATRQFPRHSRGEEIEKAVSSPLKHCQITPAPSEFLTVSA